MKSVVWSCLGAGIAGFALGLLYAWTWSPIRRADMTPDTLRADYKDSFRMAAASAYAKTGNLDRARARLMLLGGPDPVQPLSAQAQRMLAAGESFQAARDVAALAADLQSGVSSIAPSATAAPASASASSPKATNSVITIPGTPSAQVGGESVAAAIPTVMSTPTPRPTRTPVPPASAPFQLVNKESVCKPNSPDGLLQIVVLDARGQPMPGVEITISWVNGEDHVFTGLKPELGDGYADYVMRGGLSYALVVDGVLPPVSGLTASPCEDSSGQARAGGLKLTFRQP